MIEPIAVLDAALREAGIPIEGVSQPAPGTYLPQFRPEATTQQRNQAAAIIASFDATTAVLASKRARAKAILTSDEWLAMRCLAKGMLFVLRTQPQNQWTWANVKTATRTAIDNETDPEA